MCRLTRAIGAALVICAPFGAIAAATGAAHQEQILPVQYRSSPYHAPPQRHPHQWGYAPPPWGGGPQYSPPVVRRHLRPLCPDYGWRGYYGVPDRKHFRSHPRYRYDRRYR